MPRVSNVLLIRHGESAANAGLPAADAAASPLTELGLRHARAVAATVPEPPALIVVSPYARAQQTSVPTRERFPTVPVEEWPVQEFTFLPAAAYRGTTEQDLLPALEAYWAAADPQRVEGEGAESFAAFLARVQLVRGRLETAACARVVI